MKEFKKDIFRTNNEITIVQTATIISSSTTPGGEDTTKTVRFANFIIGETVTWSNILTETTPGYIEYAVFSGTSIFVNLLATSSGSFLAPSATFDVQIDVTGSSIAIGNNGDINLKFLHLGIEIPPNGNNVHLSVSTV